MLGDVRVALDLRAVQSHYADRGIGRYVGQQAVALQRVAPDLVDDYLVTMDGMARPPIEDLAATGRVRWVGERGPNHLNAGPLVFHAMSPFEPLPLDTVWPRQVRRDGAALVATAYDLIPLVFVDHYLADPSMRRAYEEQCGLLRAADAVVAISEHTAADVERLLSVPASRLHVVGGGVHDFFSPSSRPKDALVADLSSVLPQLKPGFVFYTGGIDFRKNLERFLEGVALMPDRLRERTQVVITCAASDADRLRLEGLAAEMGVDLLMTGWVSDDVLRDLYRGCRAFIFPSRYEGYGLPVAEALACGAVVVVGDNSSLRELVPDPAARFDADSPEAIASVLVRALTDETFRADAQARAGASAFTWDDVARRTMGAYEAAAAASTKGSVRWRPMRLAVLTPYPPDASGIAEHSRHLIDALPHGTEVEIFASGHFALAGARSSNGVIRDIGEFAVVRELRRFDREIVCIGNSHFHVGALDALERSGGEVFLHDIRLTGLYWARAQDPLAESFDEALERMYGDRIPAAARGAAHLGDEDAARLGIRMLRDVIAYADRIWVQSEFAHSIVLSEAAAHGLHCPPVHVVPFPFPAPFTSAASSPEPGLIVSMGVVSSVKHCDRIVAALPLLQELVPAAKLAFVGPVGDGEREWLEGLAASLGVADEVVLTGATDSGEYADWLLRSEVAVQLREVSNGEGSFTAAEAMSNRVPVVVSDVGWCGELPDGAVEKAPVGASPADLAWRIARLMRLSKRERAEMTAAAASHAAQQTFASIAQTVVSAGRPGARPRGMVG